MCFIIAILAIAHTSRVTVLQLQAFPFTFPVNGAKTALFYNGCFQLVKRWTMDY